MDHFQYRDGVLFAEDVPASRIAEEVGTPCYVYSRATLERHWHAFDQAFADREHLICYAVKANSSLGVLNLLARLGSGFDIVSGGELFRVIKAGGDPRKVVFSGVGKTAAELRYALEQNIYCINVESESELHMLAEVAAGIGTRAPVALRVNPDVDAQTHPYISTGLRENKFGVDIDTARRLFREAHASEHLDVSGIDCHIGSQLTRMAPFLDAIDRTLALIRELAAEGIVIEHLDIGGGLGVTYKDETPPHPGEYAQAIAKKLAGTRLKVIMEPGRAIAANAGILLTRVMHLKSNEDKHFAIVDGAMNDLLRPSLYGSWQDIIPALPPTAGENRHWDIVGPVCETGDFLGKDRELALSQGDLLAVRSAGAYGFTMSSNYNSRPRAAEVMVDGGKYHIIRARESLDDLVRGETLLPE